MTLIVALLLSSVLMIMPIAATSAVAENNEETLSLPVALPSGYEQSLIDAGYTGITSLDGLTGGGKYYLKNDITVAGPKGLPQGSAANLTTIDGNGHTITLGSPSAPAGDALFGWSAYVNLKNFILVTYIKTTADSNNKGASLSNGMDQTIKLENLTVKSNIVIDSNVKWVGGILNKVQNGGNLSMTNVVHKGSITVNSGKNPEYIGGMVGYFTNGDTVGIKFENCRNEADIIVNGNKAVNVGGFVGYITPNSAGTLTLDVDNSENTGDITLNAASGNTSAGGIVGNCATVADFDNVVNSGNILVPSTGKSWEAIGGIAGVFQKKTDLNNCVNNGSITVDKSAADSGFTGGIVGNIWGGPHTYTKCVNNGAITVAKASGGVTAGIVGRNNSTLSLIKCINNGAITSGGKTRVAGILAQTEKNNTTIDGCLNFGDISYAESTANGNESVAGILAEIINGGSNPNGDASKYTYPPSDKKYIIRNSANMGDITVTGKASALHVGGMVGKAAYIPYLEITNCVNAGDITANNAEGWSDIGGMVGSVVSINAFNASNCDWWWGGITNCTVIFKDCHNLGTLNGKTVGGILGAAHQMMEYTVWFTAENCTNSGTLTGSDGAGGIIGKFAINGGSENFGQLTVNNCYNEGNVTGWDYAGGIVAYNGSTAATETTGNPVYTGKISNSGNKGTIAVTGGNNNKSGDIIAGSAAETVLDNNAADATAAAAIGTALYNKTKNDITDETYKANFAGNFIFSTAQWTAKPADGVDIVIFKNFAVTSDGANLSNATVYGNGHTITVTNAAAITTGTNIIVKDLKLAGTISNDGSHLSPLVLHGLSGNCVIENVESSVAISLSGSVMSVGGIVSKVEGPVTFRNCTFKGSITSTGDVAKANYFSIGGLAGSAFWATTVENCTNEGNITISNLTSAGHEGIGGLVGVINSNNDASQAVVIDGALNKGNISVTMANGVQNLHVGGIVGRVYKNLAFEVKNSVNKGNVALNVDNGTGGWEAAGGIVGNLMTPSTAATYRIYKCINDGNVTGPFATGGILGGGKQLVEGTTVTVDTCINNGDVTALNNAGGIVGHMSDNNEKYDGLVITDSVNTGTVRSTYLGGNSGSNAATTNAGGILGRYAESSGATKFAQIKNCVNAGHVVLDASSDGRGCDSWKKVGGILGDFKGKVNVEDCIHMGTLATGGNANSANGTFPITNAIETCYNNGGYYDTVFIGAWMTGSNNLYLDGSALQDTVKHIAGALSGQYVPAYTLSSKATLAQVADKLEALHTVGFSTERLDTLVDEYDDTESAKENDYTVKSWTPYENAVTAAKTTLDTYNKTDAFERQQYVLIDAEIAITNAKNNRVLKADYYADLQTAIDAVKDLTNENYANYTKATWDAFQTALANAQNAITSGNEVDAEIAQLKTELETAHGNLIGSGALKNAIDTADALNNDDGKYTTVTWDAMIAKLNAAKTALENATTTDAVATATNELNDAVSALVTTAVIKEAIAEYGNESNENPEGGENYTAASWTNYTNALAAANDALTNAATTAEAEKAAADLQAAKEALVPASTAVRLQTLINEVKTLVEDDYTVATWAVLSEKLTAAEDAMTNSSDDENALIAAETALRDAKDALINIKALKEAIADCVTDIAGEFYTTDSYDAYQAAKNAANAALTATAQSVVDDATATLIETFNALELLPVNDDQVEDMTGEIEHAESLNPDYYTEDTYNAYLEKVAEVEALLNDPAATQYQVNEALNALLEAKQALVKSGATEDDYAALTDAIEQAEALAENSDIYMPTAWQRVVDAMAFIRDNVVGTDDDKELVESARLRLEAAMASLVERPTESAEEQIAARIEAMSDRNKLAAQMILRSSAGKDLETVLALLDALEA